MNKSIKLALATLAFGGAIAAVQAPALADHVTVAVGVPGIAFGYNDGYWDRDHAWHAWKDRDEAARWRAEHADHYYDYRHDRDRGQGWRDADRWWDRH